MSAHWVANHLIQVGNHKLGVSVINTVPTGQCAAIGAPRLWSKPINVDSNDYGDACNLFVSECDALIAEVQALRDRFEQAAMMYQLTGEIPDAV